jgi:biopolymer transport protein ExbB
MRLALVAAAVMAAAVAYESGQAWSGEPAEGGEAAAPAPAPAAGPVPLSRPAVKAAEPFSVKAVVDEMRRQFEAGGLTNWFILLLSVCWLANVLERAFRLRRGVIAPVGLAAQANRLWQEGRFDDLLALCRQRRSTMARVIQFMVEHRASPQSDVGQAIGDISAADLTIHQMLLYPLAVVATLAPLLGLFGTVVGMIECFETVAVAGELGDPSLLASGISKALVTTEFGLLVAMPSLFFYHMFKLRTNYLANMLDREVTTLTSEWFLKREAQA